MIGALAALELRGAELLATDTDVLLLVQGVLKAPRYFADRQAQPECERKIRGVSGGLALCMAVDLVSISGMGASLSGTATLDQQLPLCLAS